MLQGLEEVVVEALKTSCDDRDIVCKIFEGLTVQSNYKKGKYKYNNLTGKSIYVDPKRQVKAKTTRVFNEKISNYDKPQL